MPRVRTFDPTGRHVHTASSLGARVDYGHDGQGRLQEMSSGEWTAKWLRDSVGLEAERHLTGGVHVTTRRDRFGRETFKSVGARNVEQLRRRYTWDMDNIAESMYAYSSQNARLRACNLRQTETAPCPCRSCLPLKVRSQLVDNVFCFCLLVSIKWRNFEGDF